MIYLCRYTLMVSEYPDYHQSEDEEHFRLVQADTEDEAHEKLRKAVEYKDPYARSVRLDTVSISEMIT